VLDEAGKIASVNHKLGGVIERGVLGRRVLQELNRERSGVRVPLENAKNTLGVALAKSFAHEPIGPAAMPVRVDARSAQRC
jgi:hypothetical protein